MRRRVQAWRGRPAVAGFTLIEVLLATVLLAAGLALAFATLRAASATTQRGEQLAQRSERMRAVEGFLRRRIASALPMGFHTDPATGKVLQFVGTADGIRFVADLPDYLGQGGPHMHHVAVVDDGRGPRLVVSFSMVLGGALVEERDPRPPEDLVPDLVAARFAYRGLDADNRLGPWTEQWEDSTRLPLQVRLDIRDGDGVAWPRLVVALPQGGAPVEQMGRFN